MLDTNLLIFLIIAIILFIGIPLICYCVFIGKTNKPRKNYVQLY